MVTKRLNPAKARPNAATSALNDESSTNLAIRIVALDDDAPDLQLREEVKDGGGHNKLESFHDQLRQIRLSRGYLENNPELAQ